MRLSVYHLRVEMLSLLLLATISATAAGQGPPKTLKLDGPTATGALRCAADESVQFALIGLDENLNSTSLGQYAPEARSTNESVVVARVGDEAATRVNVLCVADGEAWITVEAAGVRADVPVLVGTSRRKASPTGPHPELAQAASGRGSVAQGQQATQSRVSGAPAQLPITVKPEGPAQLPITVKPEGPAQLPITVRPDGPAQSTSAVRPVESAPAANPIRSEPTANAQTPVRAGVSPDVKAGVSSGPPANTAASDRIGGNVNSSLTPPPTEAVAVHATNFKAFAGYGRNVLSWMPAPGAAGYRLDRAIWDPAKSAMVPGSTVEFPTVAASDPSGLIHDTAFVDLSVKPGTQYVYWLRTHFGSPSGGFYFPLVGDYPAVTVTPRDPKGMTWLPADWTSPPKILSIVPSATGVSIEWAPKGGSLGYIIMRTRQGTSFDLKDYEKCYPVMLHFEGGIDKSLIRPENKVAIPIRPDVTPRMCFGVFAIYPDRVEEDGTPMTYAFVNHPPSRLATDALRIAVHSQGVFIWAEWDSSQKKWRVLPQGSFPVHPCILDDSYQVGCLGGGL